MMAGRVARTLQRDNTSIFRRRLGPLEVERYLRKSQWTRAVAKATTAALPNWRELLEPDRPHPEYRPLPPWEAPAIAARYTRLPSSKNNCSREELRQLALQDMEHLHVQGSHVYYTDGSVDPDSGRSGAAFITGDLSRGWRTTDHCSSLQTELAAIQGALQHFESVGGQRMVLHTDSKSALQALERGQLQDNVALITSVLSLANNCKARGATVVFNWIPSHVGLRGNECVDVAAREAARGPTVMQHIRPSLSQSRALARRTVCSRQAALLREQEGTSRSMAWYYIATEETHVSPNLRASRVTEVATHRLRLGYRTRDEIFRDRDPEPCNHCTSPTVDPLLHYLLHCPRTATLRAQPPPPGAEQRRAAMVVRRAMETPDALATILKNTPPPR